MDNDKKLYRFVQKQIHYVYVSGKSKKEVKERLKNNDGFQNKYVTEFDGWGSPIISSVEEVNDKDTLPMSVRRNFDFLMEDE